MYEQLFKEGKIGNVVVPNRIAMTAMGNHMADPGGWASDKDVAFYEARAKGGVGLVILECMAIDYEHGKGNVCQMSVDDDKFVPGLRRVADAIHAAGSVVAGQIYHPGRQGIAELNGVESMPAPSAVEDQAVHQPVHEMTKQEIDEMVARFAAAARRCKEAGLDAVELHGAHGYLINQFLSPYTNKRIDEYGGSLENRCRFAKEVIEAVRAEVGSDYPIIIRLSVDEHLEYNGLPGEGIHLDEGVEIAKMMEDYGVQAIDVSCGIYETMNTAWEPVGFDEGWKIEAPAAVKAVVSVPVIGVSIVRNPEYAEQVLTEGKVDFVASARTFFADPDWGVKAKEGREKEIRRCIQCMHCMETLMEADITGVTVGCAVNYQAGREAERGDAALSRDGDGKTVVIIGAGPAGMEAAIVAAKRGFEPVVFEKTKRTGGQINYAAVPPKKGKIRWLIDYQRTMAEKLGVEIRCGVEPTVEDIKALDPYAVIVAQGSKPIMPAAIPGLDQDNVYDPTQILTGEAKLEGQDVAVIGTGMTGIETAEFLAEAGNRIYLFEMLDEIGPGLFFQNMIDVMSRLGAHDPEIRAKHRLVAIDGNKATFTNLEDGKDVEFTYDSFVVSLGVAPNKALVDDIEKTFDKVFVVGDAMQGGRIEAAIRTGYEAAFDM